jgi:hypothetical protein
MGAICLVRQHLRVYRDKQDNDSLDLIAESSVGPVKRLIEASCDIIDADAYDSACNHIKSVVSQRMVQSRLAFRMDNMDDDELTQAFQEMCAEVTREVSFALLRRDVIRPKSDVEDKLASELYIKNLLVSCDYSKLGWMWAENVLTAEMRAGIPSDHYHAIRHELYYICVAEAVRMHRAIELGNFEYRKVRYAIEKIRSKAQQCISEGRIPQFQAKTLGKSRPLFQRVRIRHKAKETE